MRNIHVDVVKNQLQVWHARRCADSKITHFVSNDWALDMVIVFMFEQYLGIIVSTSENGNAELFLQVDPDA